MQVNQVFTVSIQLNAGRDSRGVQVAASFNPAGMQCDSVAQGDMFQNWATSHGGSGQ